MTTGKSPRLQLVGRITFLDRRLDEALDRLIDLGNQTVVQKR